MSLYNDLANGVSDTDSLRRSPAALRKGPFGVAEKILRLSNVAKPTSVLGVPLDPTIGAVNANSTVVTSATTAFTSGVSTGATIPVTDPRIQKLRGRYATAAGGFVGDGATRTGNGVALTRAGYNGQGIRWCMGGTDFDMCLLGGTDSINESKGQIRITDLRTGVKEFVKATQFTVNSDGARYYRFTFADARPRLVEAMFGRRVFIRGINVLPSDTIWSPPAANLSGAVLSDSYVDVNVAGIGIGEVWSAVMADCLGIDALIPAGVSGSGWYNSSATVSTFLDRINNGDFSVDYAGNLEFILIWGSQNDNAATDAQVQANMVTGLTKLAADQPNALIMCAGPQRPGAFQTTQGRYDAMKAAFESVFTPGGRGVWLDNSPSSVAGPWMTGTGRVGATANNGNNDIYIGADNAHWNLAGHTYGGARIARDVIAACRTLVGG